MVEVIGRRSARLSMLGLVEEKPLAEGGIFIVSGAELCRVFNIYRILLIELSVLSQFQIPLKLRRRVIIARIIRSGYNLIKDWLPLKHFQSL